MKHTGEIGLVKFLSMIHYKSGVRISLLCGKRAVEDYEKKRDQVQKISVLLSAKPGEIAAAVEKMKDEIGKLQEKLSESYGKLIEHMAESLEEGDGSVCVFEESFGGVQLRHLVNCLIEKKKGKTVLALSENPQGGFLYVLGSQSEDMRLLSKELNQQLDGRGGGNNLMAQGTFFCGKDRLCAILIEKGFYTVNGQGPETENQQP